MLTVQRVPLAELVPDPQNVRSHDEKNLAAIRGSLTKFGQVEPLVVRRGSNVVIGGNGRLEAMRSLEWTHAAVTYFDGSDAEARALGLALNRTAELAAWDDGRLAAALAEVKEAGLSEAAGWTDADLAAVMEGVRGEVVEDEVPEPPADPVTKAGDLWLMGEHRLLCGDSTRVEDVRRLMAGGRADLLISDPPYGVSYVGKTKDAMTVENDELDEDKLSSLVSAAFDHAQNNCRDGAYWYATVPAGPLHIIFAQDWKRRGILRQIMVWAKDSMVLGHSEYHYRHEPILFGWIPGNRHKNADRTRTTLWQYDRPKASREHPTMKPVKLWSQAVTDGSRPGELVYDPFLGSGTTLIAAEQLGRRCYGMEISPAYCEVIVKRWETLTGKNAVLER